MNLQDTVHNWDVPVLDLEDHDLANANRRILIVQEQDVSSLECRLHRSTAQMTSQKSIKRISPYCLDV